MAHRPQPQRAQKHHADLPALTRSGTEPGRKCLAVSPLKLALQSRLRHLPRNRRRRLRGLAETRGETQNHHFNRHARMGPRRSIAVTLGITPFFWLTD